MGGIYEVGSLEHNMFEDADFGRSLDRRLDKEIETLTNQVITGQVDSYEMYKYKAGIIQGLNLAKKHMRELR